MRPGRKCSEVQREMDAQASGVWASILGSKNTAKIAALEAELEGIRKTEGMNHAARDYLESVVGDSVTRGQNSTCEKVCRKCQLAQLWFVIMF